MMKFLKCFTIFLLLISIFDSMTSCKKEIKDEFVFENKPFTYYYMKRLSYSPMYEAAYEFTHSIYDYYDGEWLRGDDSSPDINDRIGFILYFGWRDSEKEIDNQQSLKAFMGIEKTNAIEIYVQKDNSRTTLKRIEGDFFSDEYSYFNHSHVPTFNSHYHLTLPPSTYNGCDNVKLNIVIGFETEDNVLKPFFELPLYIERHGDKIWLANDPKYFTTPYNEHTKIP